MARPEGRQPLRTGGQGDRMVPSWRPPRQVATGLARSPASPEILPSRPARPDLASPPWRAGPIDPNAGTAYAAATTTVSENPVVHRAVVPYPRPLSSWW
jgi:hypothetical protein